MRCRIAAGAACSLLVACALSACGGSSGNGVASKSPEQIISSARRAVGTARSAHVSGRYHGSTGTTSFSLDLVTGKGGRGRIRVGALSLQLEVLNDQLFVNAPSLFWQRHGLAALASTLQGKWTIVPPTGTFASLLPLTDLQTLLSASLPARGALVKGASTTVNGHSAVVVHDTTGAGTIYVATTGEPYPLKIVQLGARGGHISLSHINESVALTPPPNAIDISKLR